MEMAGSSARSTAAIDVVTLAKSMIQRSFMAEWIQAAGSESVIKG
jgi:hypothetical protein